MNKVSHFRVVTAFECHKTGKWHAQDQGTSAECIEITSSSRKCTYGKLFICTVLKYYRQRCTFYNNKGVIPTWFVTCDTEQLSLQTFKCTQTGLVSPVRVKDTTTSKLETVSLNMGTGGSSYSYSSLPLMTSFSLFTNWQGSSVMVANVTVV
jgi:hypothetical protein